METALYRAVQEALLNAQKHSNARRADVLLESRNGSLTAIIEDNGCGFDAETLLQNLAEGATPDRLGLLGIKERLESVGGTLDIESAIGQGTTLFLRVPLPEQSA
jgi:signal transduction histidine kinase